MNDESKLQAARLSLTGTAEAKTDPPRISICTDCTAPEWLQIRLLGVLLARGVVGEVKEVLRGSRTQTRLPLRKMGRIWAFRAGETIDRRRSRTQKAESLGFVEAVRDKVFIAGSKTCKKFHLAQRREKQSLMPPHATPQLGMLHMQKKRILFAVDFLPLDSRFRGLSN